MGRGRDFSSRFLVSPSIMQIFEVYAISLGSNFPFTTQLSKGRGAPNLTFSFCPSSENAALPSQSCVYKSPFQTVEGKPAVHLYRLADHEVLRFTGVVDFHLWPDRITGHPAAPDREPLIEIHLLGPVLSYWLEKREVSMLHASAVAVGDRAAGFISSHGGGKSGIVAALMQAGGALLTDDILPVEERDGIFLGRPGYPQMRMWPDEAEHFLGHFEHLPLIHPDLTKRRVAVGAGGLGSFHDSPLPLSCLYLLDRQESRDTPIEIHSISPRDGLIELLRHSFTPLLVEAAGLQPARFDRLARLVRQVPVRRLRYPSGFDLLPRVAEAVRLDLERC
jgi:hypothetical protein